MNEVDFKGGAKRHANNHDLPAKKDETITNLIPENISECALYLNKPPGAPCMSSDTIAMIGSALNINGNNIVEEAKAKLNCENERCVLGKLTNQLGEERVRREINLYLKVKGPTNSQLLSNVHIDSTLRQWTKPYPMFFPYNFNMLNYASYAYEDGYILHHPDTLATILFSDLYFGEVNGTKYKCCACVINSDTYQGDGKHWMALFADARSNDRWTVEFFNSSGNSPAPEWVSWLEKTKNAMELIVEKEKNKPRIEILKVSSIRHQQSRSECGLYSLFYIWARLHGVAPEYFMNNPISDQLMFEFRQHLFEDPSRRAVKRFVWSDYKKTVNIEWEPD